MKQLLQNLRSGETTVVDVPVPALKPGMALVRTAASLVSAGTERMLVEFAEKNLLGKARARPDLVRQVLDKARREGLITTVEAAFNRLDQPMPLGYSSAGTIVAAGANCGELHAGQRVACAGGNYAVHAEYALVPKNLITPLPDIVDFESAAFNTLGAIALHGFRLGEPQIGESIAVIGLGLLGLLAMGIALAAGCQVIGIDLNPQRVKLAQSLGATAIERELAESAASSFSRGRGVDMVLICADTPSNDPIQLAGTLARDRARVVAVGAVGLQIPRKVYYEKELAFINSRSYGPGRYDPSYEEGGHDYPLGYVRWSEGRNLEAFTDLLASGRLDVKPLITHRFPIQDAPQAYQLITGKTGEHFLGVLLTYADQEQVDAEPAPLQTSPQQPARSTAAPAKVRLGVLGAGNFATAVMLPALRKVPQIELVRIASGAGMHAQTAAQKFGFQHTAENEEAIFNDPSVNTVAVLTRHDLHARQVIAGLQAGKHVFCEKPLALNEEELVEISSTLSSESTGWLAVGFNRRFASLSRSLYTFFEKRQEPLAISYRVNAGYIPLSHWTHDPEQGGGRIIGEGCHFIDFLTFLVGKPPVSVTAQALPEAGKYRQDNVIMTFAFADGSLGTVSYLANGDKAFPKERIEVFSGGRVAVLEDYRSLEMVADGRRRIIRSRLRQDKGHRAEWERFAACILAGGPPPIPYSHLFAVTRASFAVIDAVRSGERILIPG